MAVDTVGRSVESARIARCIAAVGPGRGSVVLLAGEPGIGKTRLALDAAETARRVGLGVAWGRCSEAGAAPALWPWTQVVREIAAAEGAPEIRTRLGPAADDVLALTGVRDVDTGAAAPAEVIASRRFRLFDGVARLIREGPRPVLVVIEDLHRADDLSLALLRRMAADAGRGPILLLATYRDNEHLTDAVAHALAEVAPLPWCADVALGPLTDGDAAGLVTSAASRAVSPGEVAGLVERAGGNPFFLLQLAHAPHGVDRAVPTSVREVIRERVAGLPDGVAALLEALAVGGREAEIAMAATVSGIPTGRAARLFAAAEAGGLLTVDPDGGTARFTHALVQETLFVDVGPERRSLLHEGYTAVLADRAPVDPGWSAALAHHALRAARAGRPVDCVPPLRAAARTAAGRLAFAEAARLLGDALGECGERTADRIAVLLELGTTEVHAGRPDVARQHFERAARLGDDHHDPLAVARAALGVGACVVTVGQVDRALVALLERAVRGLGDGDGGLRSRVLARLAVELYWDAGGAESRVVSGRALAAAEGATGEPRTLAEALWSRLFTLRGPDRLDERLALGRRLVDLTVGERLDDLEPRGRVWLLPELLRAGDMPAYRAGVARLARLAERSGQPLHRWYAELFAAQRATVEGSVAAAAVHSAAALALSDRLGTEAGRIYHIAQQVALRRDVGGLRDVVVPLGRLADAYPALVTLRMLVVVVQAELGQRDEAAAGLSALAAHEFAVVPPDALWTATLCFGAEVAHLLGDRATAASAAHLLEPYRGICAVQGLPTVWGAVDRAVGLGLLARGERVAGVAALESALASNQRWGLASAAIRTRLDLASVLSDATAGTHLEAARAESGTLGLRQLVARADVLGVSAPARPGGPGGTLSPREAEVLGLLTTGATNGAIAATLVLSINTVERHVRNVYVKLGVANRAEAAALAIRHEYRPRRSGPTP